MQELDLLTVRKRLVSGVFALASRTFILQAVSFGATFILTILLSPSAFGIFFVVSAVISFLSYFSDIGLAAALIQKKKDPDRQELVTAFTVQQGMVGILVVAAFFLSPLISRYYGFGEQGQFLLVALLLSFFLSSLKTIPSVLLERKLAFHTLVIPQILETVAFYLVAIGLAYTGFGIASFGWAALVRGVVGVAAIYVLSPWPMGIGISRKDLGVLVSFGLPFQANSLLALVKDDLLTIVLGKMLPFSHIGYIGWAKKWAEAPLRLIMDNIIRVTFPAYARLQDDKKILGKAIEKSFFFLAYFILPASFLLVLIIRPLVLTLPKYGKWEPAVVAFYFFTGASLFSAFSTPIINALNAIGKIKLTLFIMVFWTVLTWLLVPAATHTWGYTGTAAAFFAISFTGFVPVMIMRRFVRFSVLSPLVKPAAGTAVFAAVSAITLFFIPGTSGIVAAGAVGAISYGVFSWLFMRAEITPYLPRFNTR